MSNYQIRRAAVLGAGTMGSRLAAHLANAGIPSILLDISPKQLNEEEQRKGLPLESPEVRNRIVRDGWKAALSSKPAALFAPNLASMVTTGNFDDNLPLLEQADWIIEAVTERLDIKRRLLEQVERHRRPGAIVSSNTSGIPIHSIAEGFPEDFRRNFLGTHFFNPPRYLKLLEIIPTPDTDPALVDFMTRFGEDRLGKGAVLCKDTPNFIANRIGIYGVCLALHLMLEMGLNAEEVDALTGPVLGRPKSATFRTIDVVGLDTLALVARHLESALPEDRDRGAFALPPFVAAMIEKGRLGEKAGQGFYKRVKGGGGSEILFLDLATMDYRPLGRPQLKVVDKAARAKDWPQKLRVLTSGSAIESVFLWRLLSSTISYAAARVPEISDDILSVDRAMKWGFAHQLGPFETWDALGVAKTAERLRSEGRAVPGIVEDLLSTGRKSFYKTRAGRSYCFAPEKKTHVREEERPGWLVLPSPKDRKKLILGNKSASLLDIGEGVACLAFHTKMNTIDAGIIEMAHSATLEVENNWEGMVVANQGENFSAGANLVMVLGAAKEGRWEELDGVIRTFQEANMRLRYCSRPVVVAPHGLTLGGGCEIALHGDRVVAAAELYIGLVEVGVGLIPAAGGCKELVLRAADAAGSDSDMALMPRIQKIFEMVGLAKVSTSALEAKNIGLLRPSDPLLMNGDHRLAAARDQVLSLARAGYVPGPRRTEIPVLGRPGLATLKLGLHMMHRSGFISEYDKVVGTHLSNVLTGGAFLGVTRVSEQYLLDLEREAFLALCGQEKTRERMEHLLVHGKPLRN